VGIVDQRIDRSPHPRLEHWLEASAQLLGQKRFKRSPADLIEIRLIPRDFGFPLVALKVPGVGGRLDGLRMAAALAPDPEDQAFLRSF
jgi:hypothetical protein